MVIECWQRKVKRVDVVSKPNVFATTSALASVPVLQVFFDEGWIDPFTSYYTASRQPRIHAPHHAFANITRHEHMQPFFREFGFPSFEGGREVLAGDVMIEAKRFRLLMEAWEAFRAGALPVVRERLAELAFARHWGAHWFYWPPPLLRDTEEERAHVEEYRRFREWELKHTGQAVSTYTTKEELYRAMVSETDRVCASPVSQVEFTPELGMYKGKLTVRWSLRPVRFLGAEDLGKVVVAHEEPYIATPYGLMFLLDLSAGNETRVCGDPFCRQVFGATRRNQAFCSQSCAHRTAVRKFRSRQRQRR